MKKFLLLSLLISVSNICLADNTFKVENDTNQILKVQYQFCSDRPGDKRCYPVAEPFEMQPSETKIFPTPDFPPSPILSISKIASKSGLVGDFGDWECTTHINYYPHFNIQNNKICCNNRCK